jgi:hypothetical protein
MTCAYFDDHPDAPKGVQCLVCGRMSDQTGGEILELAQRGWPTCCGVDMELVHDTGSTSFLLGSLPV